MQKAVLAMACAFGFFSLPAAASVINLDTNKPLRYAVELDAGTWEITPVGTDEGGLYEGYTVWGNVSGCTDGLNCGQGWRWGYRLVDEDNQLVSAFLTTSLVGNTANAGLAFDIALANGPFSFTLDTAQTLYFTFSDSNYSDNKGGVSLNLSLVQSNDVPVPATALLIGVGLVGLASRRKA